MSDYPRPAFEEHDEPAHDPEVDAVCNIMAEVFGIAPPVVHQAVVDDYLTVMHHYNVPLNELIDWIHDNKRLGREGTITDWRAWCEGRDPEELLS